MGDNCQKRESFAHRLRKTKKEDFFREKRIEAEQKVEQVPVLVKFNPIFVNETASFVSFKCYTSIKIGSKNQSNFRSFGKPT